MLKCGHDSLEAATLALACPECHEYVKARLVKGDKRRAATLRLLEAVEKIKSAPIGATVEHLELFDAAAYLRKLLEG